MGGWLALAGLMVVAGVLAGGPGLYLVAAVTAAYGAITRLWSRYGMGRITYARRFTADRAVAGDDVGLDVEVWNQKPLPLPWVAADDPITEGLEVAERPTMERDNERIGRRLLHNAWSLAWYERVIRHFHLEDLRRGVYEVGPVRLRVRDLLGRDAASGEYAGEQRLVVAPRTVRVPPAGRDVAPFGDRRARQSLYADPALFGGVRPFQPGDSRRRIHWRATARLGTPVSRRYEPARGREVLIALDVQTIAGAHWEMTYDDDAFEGLCVAVASIARRLIDDGAAVGLAAAGYTGSIQQRAWLAPACSRGQSTRVCELLARIGPIASGPFAGLLTWLTARLRPGSSVLVLSARDPSDSLAALRRLARSGYQVELIFVGEEATAHAALARHAGLHATATRLTPDWQRAHALAIAG